MLLEEMRKKLVAIGDVLYKSGFVRDMQGNFSIYDKKSGLIVITPSQIPYSKHNANNMCVIDCDGNIIEGLEGCKPTSEIALHTKIYKNIPGVYAVIHTHPIHVCAFSIAHEPIRQTLADVTLGFHGEVPIADYADPGTAAVADEALKVMKNGKNRCILAHHGLLVADTTLEKCLKSTFAIDDEAKTLLLARAAGMHVEYL